MTRNSNQNHFLRISSPLDEGEEHFFQVHRIEGSEEISCDFEYHLTLSSTQPADFSLLLGKRVTLSLGLSTKKGKRYLSGVITQMEEVPGNQGHPDQQKYFYYHAELRSALWPLSLTRESRIFYDVNNTVLKILVELLMEYGFDDLANTCIRRYEYRPFCVMYDESIMNFCHRMLEREGMFWYWKHEKNGATLTLGDSTSVLPSCPNLEAAILQTKAKSWTQEDQILSLQASSRIIPGAYEVSDYNPMEPPVYHFQSRMPTGMPKLKVAEYPTDFSSLKGGQRRMNERMHGHEAKQNLISGKSYIRSLMVGHKFTLKASGRPEDGKEFVVSKLKTLATPNSYENEFEAFPADLPYHPLPRAEQPCIQGTQTAVVVGQGDKTEGDRYGWVKVHFHWDRQSKPNDPHSTCPIRVASPFAGGQRGIIFTPHIGDEVVVSFENGDPERPIIIGSVFGPQHSFPFQRGSFPRQSLIKSSEDKDSNQIKFEDLKEQELFYIKAKKDYELEVLHNHNTSVSNDQNLEVGKNQSVTTQGDQNTTIQGNRSTQTHGNQDTETDGNQNLAIQKNYDIAVSKNWDSQIASVFSVTAEGDVVIRGKNVIIEATGGDLALSSQKNTVVQSGENYSLVAKKDISQMADKNVLITADKNMEVSADQNLDVTGGKNLVIEGKEISIESAKNSVIKGAKVEIN